MHVPASQQTPPVQLPAPLHPTPQDAPVQATRAQEVMPPQVIVAKLAAAETSAAQARAPTQSTMQVSPLHPTGCPHVSGLLHRS